MDTFEHDPTYHHLVINGDGAKWITSCREYFQNNGICVIDDENFTNAHHIVDSGQSGHFRSK